MPRIVPGEEVHLLLVRAQLALGMSQGEFGVLVGASRRTASRWAARQSVPSPEQLQGIASAVHAVDPALAAAIAAEGGASLEDLGIGPPKPVAQVAPAAPAALAPPPRAFPPIALLVDSILHAAVRAAQTPSMPVPDPDSVREVLHAAFARARGLGLTIEEADAAFAPPAPAPSPPEKAGRSK